MSSGSSVFTSAVCGQRAAFTPLTLNGISQYASDFQSVLNRSVAIASIPIQQMENHQSLLESQDHSRDRPEYRRVGRRS